MRTQTCNTIKVRHPRSIDTIALMIAQLGY